MSINTLFAGQRLFITVSAGLSMAAVGLAADRAVPGAYPTIQAAIDAAQPGDVVIVADGVYSGSGNRDLDFKGKAITVRSAAGPAGCIIDCEASAADPHRGVAFVDGETSASVFQGFTIRNGATAVGAVSDPFNGAAILCANQSSPTIRDCILTGNRAACWGGAVCCSSGAGATIINTIFVGNDVGDDGGAVFIWGGGAVTLVNCLLAENTSGVTGGALTSFGGTVIMRNCTIANNSAIWGAGIYSWELDIADSIVWGNTGDSMQIRGGPTVVYSNVQAGFAGAGNIAADPRFVSGGTGDYRLSPGSPCVDAGNNALVPAEVVVDLDGAARFLDDPGTMDSGIGGPSQWVVDMGTYEFQGHSCPGEVNGDGQVDLADLALLLAEFGESGGLPESDQDHDRDVDLADLALVLANFGTACPG
ncbi:MAG: hypothetical protein AMXMBFR47_01070 [Planctomycetota bacterium]